MKKTHNWLILAALSVFASCAKEDGYSELERTQAYFLDKLNGAVSPSQWWKTSVTLKLTVKTAMPTKIFLMSEDETTLYDHIQVEQGGNYSLTAPQGMGMKFKLIYVCNKKKNSQTITLTGKNTEQFTLDVYESLAKSPLRKAEADAETPSVEEEIPYDPPYYDPNVDPSLHGYSVIGGAEHYEFKLQEKLELVEMLKILSRESVNAKTGHHLNCDYELKPNGPLSITWMMGYEASQTPHILGYYFHSPGTYSDIEFHDLSETHKYDIIDGLAKVQYQLRDTSIVAHPEYGLKANTWYDANFDMNDVFGAKTASNAKRVGDEAYNAMEVFRVFGTGVKRLRGISFPIDVPKDKHLGFYLKLDDTAKPEQWDQLRKLGIKNIGERADWKATNFSVEALNLNMTHRSCIIPYANTTWLGMEDVSTGGDLDCNDVIFGITTEFDVLQPTPVEPDINYVIEGREPMPWTIAYEDVGREADFDFNDAVIKIMPDYEHETCCVTVEAAGSPYRMYLHYDGPDGDVNLGEIHEILGGRSGRKINTSTSVAEDPFVEIDCVPWLREYTISEDAKRFWIEVQRGTCADCTDAITLATDPGQMPEALLVAGEWQWPLEEVHIFSAYNSFPQWAKDVSKTSYWNWYATPKVGTTVSY